MAIMETIVEIPVEHERNIFGSFDANIRKIEKTLNVTMIARDGTLKLVGDAGNVKKAEDILMQFLELSKRGNSITEQNVNYALALAMDNDKTDMVAMYSDVIFRTIQVKPIKPKTAGQQKYIDLIRQKMIVFGVGPAGTGKTYLAMAMAIDAFKKDEVNKIILTRPAIEAGENLGFLPGDLQSKVDPYLRPLYDALYQIMGAESYLKNVEKGLIEVAPLAYMRGRTLDNSFIILDEAQNTTPAQMKMFLTRIGFGSKAIITGDLTQKDLPFDSISGLEESLRVLRKVKEIGVCELTNKDVVRHPLVQKIVAAYDQYEAARSAKKNKNNNNKKNRR